jgi:hypothetical protein
MPSSVVLLGTSMASGRSRPACSSCCCSASEVTTTWTSPVTAAFWAGAEPS